MSDSPETASGEKAVGRAETPLISIVTASRNAWAGLQRTIESVASQTYPHVEHVIVDGASDDGTPAKLAALGEAVRWISEPDDGIADAMNKGIAMAQGDYVLILHAEDTLFAQDSLASAAGRLGPEVDVAAFEVELVRADGSRVCRRSRPLGLLTHFKMTSPHQGMLVRRALYERIGIFDTTFRIAMDYEWLLRAKAASARLVAIDETLAVMPATGVSTQLDWPAMRKRLLEDKRLQLRHAGTEFWRGITQVFWAIYMPFKRIKSALAGSAKP